MAVTAHQFVLEFPEFSSAPESLISAKLVAAARRINTTVWGAHADDGIRYLCAHLLSAHPAGESARTARGGGSSKLDAESTYWREYERLKRLVSQGFRVT